MPLLRKGTISRRGGKLPPPVGLQYEGKEEVSSSNTLTSGSTTYGDDTEAELTFTLDEERIALIMYSACNRHGATELYQGKTIGINLDGTRVALSASGPDIPNYANGATIFYIGTLAAGNHTVKGQFKANADGKTISITDRRLTIILFSGTSDDFLYVRSTGWVQTASLTLVDDTNAEHNFTLEDPRKALILYSTCNHWGQSNSSHGRKTSIEVDGADEIIVGSSAYGFTYVSSEFLAVLKSLGVGAHTVKGRYARNYADARYVGVGERQLGILFFSTKLETDFATSTTEESVTGTTFTADAEAEVTRETLFTRFVFVIYCLSKNITTTSSGYGKKGTIDIDGTEYEFMAQHLFWGGLGTPVGGDANSTAVHTLLEVAPGSHTVKGMFANNVAAQTAKLDSRTLCVLWFGLDKIRG